MKFKALILQRLFNISDEQLEYQIIDRMSFMRFLGLTMADDVPDRTTIWTFREQLKHAGVVKELFDMFNIELDKQGIIAHEGSIIDASFVEVPKQRNNRDENKSIKEGEIPESWLKEEKKSFRSQKDTDARWTKKNNQVHYGYKNHVKVDSKSKIITDYIVTDASVHDSQALESLVNESDQGLPLYADSAYVGQEEMLSELKIRNFIHEKGYRNRPLTESQKSSNKKKSETRVRVEHIFGFMQNSMRGKWIKTIGVTRAGTLTGLNNLTYNICRFRYLCGARSAQMV
jgi:IS5 family transposase